MLLGRGLGGVGWGWRLGFVRSEWTFCVCLPCGFFFSSLVKLFCALALESLRRHVVLCVFVCELLLLLYIGFTLSFLLLYFFVFVGFESERWGFLFCFEFCYSITLYEFFVYLRVSCFSCDSPFSLKLSLYLSLSPSPHLSLSYLSLSVTLHLSPAFAHPTKLQFQPPTIDRAIQLSSSVRFPTTNLHTSIHTYDTYIPSYYLLPILYPFFYLFYPFTHLSFYPFTHFSLYRLFIQSYSHFLLILFDDG